MKFTPTIEALTVGTFLQMFEGRYLDTEVSEEFVTIVYKALFFNSNSFQIVLLDQLFDNPTSTLPFERDREILAVFRIILESTKSDYPRFNTSTHLVSIKKIYLHTFTITTDEELTQVQEHIKIFQ